jgi:hypothetical protein
MMAKAIRPALGCVLAVVALASLISAQQAPGRGGAPPSPRAAAPVDLTGIWVSVVSEDWRWRMIRPAKGDYSSIPLTPAGRALADEWDPAKDETAGEQCRSYAAPAIMRVPGRVRISWQDDYTLKLETDAGTQTRLFQFQRPDVQPLNAAAATAQPSWQGFSIARWEPQAAPSTGGGFGRGGGGAPAITRSLQVATSRIRPGYLRKNGVPFSASAALTETYDTWRDSSGQWFTVMTVVRDPQNLRQPFVTTTDFKKEPDASKSDPTPCQSR